MAANSPTVDDSKQLTALLRRWAGGDPDAFEKIAPLVYKELRRIASARLRQERSGHTLQPTALVHEAYLKLGQIEGSSWQSRGHFYAFASHVMRQILTDYARRYRAAKRSGATIALEGAAARNLPARAVNLLVLDEALSELTRLDERKARAIEMRYFGGMNGVEIADALGVATATVTRDLRMAEAWLHTYLAKP